MLSIIIIDIAIHAYSIRKFFHHSSFLPLKRDPPSTKQQLLVTSTDNESNPVSGLLQVAIFSSYKGHESPILLHACVLSYYNSLICICLCLFV